MAIDPCQLCARLEFEQCTDIIIEDAGLVALTNYFWTLVDSLGNVHKGEVAAAGDGSITIPAEDLPDGLLIPAMGIFTLTLSTSASAADQVDFEIDTVTYPCIQVTFLNVIES